MSNTEEKVISQLKRFGLNQDEVEAYLFLLRAGSSTASAVAHKLGVNRMRAYRTLESLEERDFVEVAVQRPLQFSALPIDKALDHLLEEQRAKVVDLERIKQDVVASFDKLSKMHIPTGKPTFRIIQGRKRMEEWFSKMCDRASSELCIITTENGLYRMSLTGFDDRLLKLGTKGIGSRILTQISERGIDAANNYLRFADVRHIILPTVMRFVIVDETEVFTSFAMDDSMSLTTSEDVGMWTDAPSYTKAIKASFDALWKNSESAQEIINGLSTNRMLMDGLGLTAEKLDAAGWRTDAPGKLVGESGIEHSFDLVANHQGKEDMLLVLDVRTQDLTRQMFEFNIKILDANPTISLLATTKKVGREELRLANQYDVKLINVTEARQLAEKVIREANETLRKKRIKPKA